MASFSLMLGTLSLVLLSPTTSGFLLETLHRWHPTISNMHLCRYTHNYVLAKSLYSCRIHFSFSDAGVE